MKCFKSLLLSFLFAIASSSAIAQSPQENLKTLESAKTFMSAYANDLNSANRAAIIQRYDPRGHYQLGNGRKTFLSQNETAAIYLEKWSPPSSFNWHDLSFEVLGPEAIVVTGLFDWVATNGEKRTYSYSSLLLLQNGEWKIRVEDESRALPDPKSKP